jgi:lysophospholipase L1-like esterase
VKIAWGTGARAIRVAGLIATLGMMAPAQTPEAQMSAKDVNEMCQRATQLMEAGGVSVPDLQRAAAPIIENAKQACIQLQARPGFGQPTFIMMSNLRAYLSLADSVPKPFPFPETARRQFAELRDDSARLDAHFRALLDTKDAQLRSSDRDNLKRYDEANRKLPPADPAKSRVVFFGDSITDLWRLNEYFPDRDFINRGISGQITGEMLGRLKADVIDLHPEAMLFLGGTNDLARKIPLTTIENNYLMIADLASAYRIKIIFASVTPVSDYHKSTNPSYERTTDRPPVFVNALNDWIAKLCAQRGYVFLNYHAALVDNKGQLKDDLSDDGLHPNSMGYRIMAPLALEAVQKSVKSAPAPAAAPKPVRRRATSN